MNSPLLSLPSAVDTLHVMGLGAASLAEGLHIYRVDSLPNNTTGLLPCNGSHYYGVFVAHDNDTIFSYDVGYSGPFSGGPTDIFARKNNASASWQPLQASYQTGILSRNFESYRSEYMGASNIPEINLGPDTLLCDPEPRPLSLDPGVSGAKYLWHNGSTNQSTVVQGAGTYWVQVMTLCDTLTDSITVRTMAPPVAHFGARDSFLTVFLSDSSSGTHQWLWDFGDGSFSSLQNPSHAYVDFGQYIVCLTVWNECGADTLCDTLVFKPVSVDKALEMGFSWKIQREQKQIWLSHHERKPFRFSVINLNGQVLLKKKIGARQESVFSFAHLPKGMYLMRLEQGNKQATFKWVHD